MPENPKNSFQEEWKPYFLKMATHSLSFCFDPLKNGLEFPDQTLPICIRYVVISQSSKLLPIYGFTNHVAFKKILVSRLQNEFHLIQTHILQNVFFLFIILQKF